MINKQPTTLTFSHHDGTVLSKFILPFLILLSRRVFFKKMSFPLNSSNDVLIVFPYNLSKLILIAGSNFLQRCKKYCQVG